MFKISARTVLELGSELISSDIIAFYELIKNAFDAKSRTGADVKFNIVLRRNLYSRVRQQAVAIGNREGNVEADLALLQDAVSSSLDMSAGHDRVEAFKASLSTATSVSDFVSRLDEAYRTHNQIEVSDTGSGMSLDELIENYLTIGTASRKKAIDQAIEAKDATTPFLGEKGIGRLSAMRLGERLCVVTARADDASVNVLNIDWREFGQLDALLEEITVEPWVGGPKPAPQWSGTTLTIADLTEDWTEARVRQMAEYDFARLTDPFKDAKSRPRIALFWNGTRIAIPWMSQELLAASHASFRGEYRLTSDGPELRVQLEARNLGYRHPPEREEVVLTLPDLEGLLAGPSMAIAPSALTDVGPFRFEAYWYNRRQLGGIDTIGNQQAVRQLQKKWSGILLFRDGFRVFPYGDDDDDWLGLDRKALGRTGYILNKAQFVGHVEISRVQNPGLVDQTNREGLRVTPQSEVLVQLLQHVTREMLFSFFKDVDRRHKNSPVDLTGVKAEVSSLEKRAKSALKRVRGFVPKAESDLVDDLDRAFVEFKELVDRAREHAEQVESDSRQMIQMAGVGLMVEVIAHELTRATEGTLQALESLKGKDFPSDARAKLETLRSEIKSISKRLRVLDQMSVSGRQRSEMFDLVTLIEDLKEGHRAQFERHRIEMLIHPAQPTIRVRLVKGMVVQILENLITNSIYWLEMRSAKESRFRPKIEVHIASDPPAVTFSDNGPGISKEHRDRVFQAFWSLKEKNKRRGLGLYIARENAEYLEGSLQLSEDLGSSGRLNTFVLELPEGALVK